MRRYMRIAWPVLILAAALFVPSPASAGKPTPSCRPFLAKMQTTCPGTPAFLEVGWIEGTVSGGVSLVYDDTAPPVDPASDKPNLVLSSKLGTIQMWVYSESTRVKGGWWRTFKVMRTVSTGAYAGAVFDVYMYGYYSDGVGGTYDMEGTLCSVRRLPLPVH